MPCASSSEYHFCTKRSQLIESNGKERLVLSFMSHFYDEFMLKRHTSKLLIRAGSHQHGEVDIGGHARHEKTSILKLQDAVLQILHTGNRPLCCLLERNGISVDETKSTFLQFQNGHLVPTEAKLYHQDQQITRRASERMSQTNKRMRDKNRTTKGSPTGTWRLAQREAKS